VIFTISLRNESGEGEQSITYSQALRYNTFESCGSTCGVLIDKLIREADKKGWLG
jgi:hypothetical protein